MKPVNKNQVINDPNALNNPENALNRTADNINLHDIDNDD